MSEGKDPRDPFANFPGGNPFGDDPMKNMDAWFRSMGVDPGEFRRMVEEMQRSLQEAFKGLGSDPGKSFVSGFSVKVGPDGKPSFQSFGNKPSVKPQGGVVADEREPLTDLIEEGDRFAITMELPGVEKRDIKLTMTEERLEIAVDTERRKYHKRVRLPAKVDPSTTKATYTNGILDVTVQRQAGADDGVEIQVD